MEEEYWYEEAQVELDPLEQELRMIFERFEQEEKGRVDLTEVELMVKAMGKKLVGNELQKAMFDLDTTGEMVILIDDWIKWWYDTYEVKQTVVEEVEDNVVDAWEEVTDETGQTYYYNTATGETRWELPELILKIREKMADVFKDDDDMDMEMKIRTLFAKYDADGTGTIDLDEFEDFMAALGTPLKGQELEATMRLLDKSGDNLITADEFLKWWAANAPTSKRVKAKAGSDWEMVEDGDGNVYYYNTRSGESRWDNPDMAAEMESMLTEKYGADLSLEDKVAKVFAEYDVDGTGEIDIGELANLTQALGQPMKGRQLKEAMKALDVNHDGLLSCEEFLDWWREKHKEHELGEWEEVQDDQGNIYYYNPTTGVSQWEKPTLAAKMDEMLDKYGDDLSIEMKIKRIFKLYDSDDTGEIDSIEFQKICDALGQPLYGYALENAIQALDSSGDGLISLEEFTTWWMAKQEQEQTIEAIEEQEQFEDRIRRACEQAVGKDGIEELELGLLSRVGALLRRELKGRQLMRCIKDLDKQGKRKVQVNDFIVWWKRYERDCAARDLEERQKEQALTAQDVWEQVVDENGKKYYLNPRTGETMWESPDMLKGMNKVIKNAMAKKTMNKNDHIKEIFRQFDKDGSGTIDRFELADLTAALGAELSDDQLDTAMASLDTSGDGEVSVDEFVTWWVYFQRRAIAKKPMTPATPTSSQGRRARLTEAEQIELDQRAMSPKTKRRSWLTGGSFRRKKKDGEGELIDELIDELVSSESSFEEAPSEDEEAMVLIRSRFFRNIDISAYENEVLDAIIELVEDVISITPLCYPDAAARIQRAFRARQARKRLVEALQNRYIKHIDKITGHEYYVNRLNGTIRWDEPIVLGVKAAILSPRSRLKKTRARRQMQYKRGWFDKNDFINAPSVSNGVYFRSAAFVIYDVLCAIKARIKRGIWKAFEENNLVLVQLVIRFYPKQLEKLGPNNSLPPHFAARNNYPLDLLQTIVQGRDKALLLPDRAGHTPLHLAVRDHATLDTVRVLLSSELSRKALGLRGRRGDTPLHLALQHVAPDELIQILIQASSEEYLLVTDQRRDTPLHTALRHYKNLERIQWIMNKNLQALEKRNWDGDLPLHIAFQNRVPEEAAVVLIESFPEAANIRNRQQLFPIHIALKARGLYSANLIRFMFQTQESVSGSSVLHYALQHHASFDVIQSIIEADETVCQIITKDVGNLPLHVAAREIQDLEILKLVVETYPEALMIRNKNDQLPLHMAIKNQNAANADYLLHMSPWSLNERCKNHDPLMIAANSLHDNTAIMNQLLDPPRLAPKRPEYPKHDANPFFISTLRPTRKALPLLRFTDISNESDLIALAKRKLRSKHHEPTPKWEYDEILRLMELNPLSESIQKRALLALHQKTRELSEEDAKQVILDHNIIRITNQVMYEFPDAIRLRILANAVIRSLLPTAYSKTWYKCNVDPYFNL